MIFSKPYQRYYDVDFNTSTKIFNSLVYTVRTSAFIKQLHNEENCQEPGDNSSK